MATAVLTLEFNVKGTGTSIAQVNQMKTAIERAASSINNAWASPLDQLEARMNGLSSKIENGITKGFYAAAGAVGVFSFALVGLGRSFIDVNQKFSEFDITLASSLKSASAARSIVSEVAKITATSPIPFKDLAETVTSLSVMPQLNAKFIQQSRSGSMDDPDGLLRRSVKLVEMMTTFRPDKGPSEAVFSIREALTGEFRSLQRRFDVPLSILTQASGKSISRLKQDGPEATLDALYKAFANIISPEATEKRAQLPSIAFENLFEQLFQMPSLSIGQAGPMTALMKRLNGYLDTSSNFFTNNPNDPTSGGFEKGGYADKIGGTLSRSIDVTFDKLEKVADNLLKSFGADGPTFLDRAADAIQKSAQWLGDKLPTFIDDVVVVGGKLLVVLRDLVTLVGNAAKTFLKLTEGMSPLETLLAAYFAPKAIGMAVGQAGTASVGLVRGLADQKFKSIAQPALDEYLQLKAANTDVQKSLGASLLGAGAVGGRVRVTAEQAEMLNRMGMSTGNGNQFTAGRFFSKQQLDNANGMVSTAHAGAVTAASSGGFAAFGTAIAAAALLAASFYTVTKAVDAFSDMMDARTLKEQSDINAQTGNTAMTQRLYQNLAMLSGNPTAMRDQMAQTTSNDALLSRIRGTSSWTDTILGKDFDRSALDKLVSTNKGLSIGKGTPDSTDQSDVAIPASALPDAIKIGNRSININGDNREEIANELSQFLREQALNAAKGQMTPEKQNGIRENTQRSASIDKRANAIDYSDYLGMSDYRQIFDIGGPSSTSSRTFTELQDTLAKSAGNTEEFSRALVAYNQSFFGKAQEVMTELDRLERTPVSEVVETIMKDLVFKAKEQDAAKAAGAPEEMQKRLADQVSFLEKELKNYTEYEINPLEQAKIQGRAAKANLTTQYFNHNLLAGFSQQDAFASNGGLAGGRSQNVAYENELERLNAAYKNPLSRTGTSGQMYSNLRGSLDLLNRGRTDTSQLTGMAKLDAERDNAATTLKAYDMQVAAATLSLQIATANGADTADAQTMLKDRIRAQSKAVDQLTATTLTVDTALRSGSLGMQGLAATDDLERMRRGRAEGYRYSTADTRSAYERLATSSTSNNGIQTFSDGFTSQFKMGDDFNSFTNQGIEAAQAIKGAFGDAFTDIAMGTKDVGDAFKSMAQNIMASMARILANKAAESLLSAAFGGGMNLFSSFGGAAGHSTGGYIKDGSGAGDDVPALLMRGEYVLSKRAVDAIGKAQLDEWNRGTLTQHYATGGSVGGVGAGGSYVPSGSGGSVNLTINYSGNDQAGPTSGSNAEKDSASFARFMQAANLKAIQEYERSKRRTR